MTDAVKHGTIRLSESFRPCCIRVGTIGRLTGSTPRSIIPSARRMPSKRAKERSILSASSQAHSGTNPVSSDALLKMKCLRRVCGSTYKIPMTPESCARRSSFPIGTTSNKTCIPPYSATTGQAVKSGDEIPKSIPLTITPPNIKI